MSQQRRPNSQQKMTQNITQSINNLKSQLQQQRQNNRWCEQKINKELFDFLSQINLQQYYGKIAQHCEGSLQQLIEMKSTKDIKDLPFGYQIKLQKAIEKMSKEAGNKISPIQKIEQRLQNDQKECCWICFQLIFESIDCYGKKMCSEKCKQMYLKEIQINCKRCGRVKPKYDAINSYGEWYCKQECVYSEEELMFLLIKQSQSKK
ncbi:unnamed protein product [Paramecium sonneborni]|uniref:Uncharacterized protein n=1 Tax=Paramecium sonneborni TaxID=65129 RepID=A0A8S1R049_9CILI|nr:unnamed protein product [Paramecium sonneborni]